MELLDGSGVDWDYLILIVLPFLVAAPFLFPWFGGRIAKKAGFSKWYGFVLLFPPLGILAIWVFAFIRWPRRAKDWKAYLQLQEKEMSDAHFFISYSREQLYFAESLTLNLKKHGVQAWFDLEQLTPGSDWSGRIESSLASCKGLILIASQASLHSEYVHQELSFGQENHKPIYVVLFESVELPKNLSSRCIIDFRGWFSKAVSRLSTCIRTGNQEKDSVPRPNRFGLPTSISPGVGLLAAAMGVLAFSWPILAVQISINDISPLVLVCGGVVLSLWAVWQLMKLLRRQYITKNVTGVLVFPVILSFFLFLATTGHPGLSWVQVTVQDSVWLILKSLVAFSVLALMLTSFSKDLLRWTPSGENPPLRKLVNRFAGKTARSFQARSSPFLLHYGQSDRSVAKTVRKIFTKAGHHEVLSTDSPQDAIHILILSNRTPKKLLEHLLTAKASFMGVLASSVQIDAGDPLSEVFRFQFVDFRKRIQTKLVGLADYFKYPTRKEIPYSREIVPEGFSKLVAPLEIMALATVFDMVGAFAILSGVFWIGWNFWNNLPIDSLALIGIFVGPWLVWLSSKLYRREISNLIFSTLFVCIAGALAVMFYGLIFNEQSPFLLPVIGNTIQVDEMKEVIVGFYVFVFGINFFYLGHKFQDWLPSLFPVSDQQPTLHSVDHDPRRKRNLVYATLVATFLLLLHIPAVQQYLPGNVSESKKSTATP